MAEALLAATDWSRFDRLTDDEIRAAWAWDADTSWPSEAALSEFELVPPDPRPAKDAAE